MSTRKARRFTRRQSRRQLDAIGSNVMRRYKGCTHLLCYLRRVRGPSAKYWLSKLQRLVELICWMVLIRLMIVLSVLTSVVVGCLLLASLAMGGPALLQAQSEFLGRAFCEGVALVYHYISNPQQARLLDHARRGKRL
ncbi:uncharacterized protein LOC144095484 [Amblyomma americanum]